MAKYNIKTNQFCALARESKWQAWLQTISEKLHNDLIEFLKTSNSCKANHDKMIEIYKDIENRKLTSQMIKFLKSEYPHTVEEIKEQQIKTQKVVKSEHKTEIKPDVFKHYNPNILTFPQKMIIQNDNKSELHKEVTNFLIGKVGGDFLIIDNTAYIEYFHLKYSKEYSNFPDNLRELVKYRAKNNLTSNTTIV